MATSGGHVQDVGEHMIEVAEHGGGMPQLDFHNWASQIFWAALALILLYQILSKKILPRIAGALEDRHNAIADDLDHAAELKFKAESAQAAYEKALADARDRANEIAEKTRAEIADDLARQNELAEAEIAAKTAEGEKRIAEIKAEAAASAKTIAIETAEQIVERLAPGLADKSTLANAVDRVLAARGGLL